MLDGDALICSDCGGSPVDDAGPHEDGCPQAGSTAKEAADAALAAMDETEA